MPSKITLVFTAIYVGLFQTLSLSYTAWQGAELLDDRLRQHGDQVEEAEDRLAVLVQLRLSCRRFSSERNRHRCLHTRWSSHYPECSDRCTNLVSVCVGSQVAHLVEDRFTENLRAPKIGLGRQLVENTCQKTCTEKGRSPFSFLVTRLKFFKNWQE